MSKKPLKTTTKAPEPGSSGARQANKGGGERDNESGLLDGTELAIALDYQPGESGAPKVVAKGQGWLANQIIAIAEANGIEIKKDPDLAQLLASVDVDSEIPLEAFTAVAEILSYVYRLNDQWPQGIDPPLPTNPPPSPTGAKE